MSPAKDEFVKSGGRTIAGQPKNVIKALQSAVAS